MSIDYYHKDLFNYYRDNNEITLTVENDVWWVFKGLFKGDKQLGYVGIYHSTDYKDALTVYRAEVLMLDYKLDMQANH